MIVSLEPQETNAYNSYAMCTAGFTKDKSGPGSDGNEGVLHIPQSSSITGTSP